MGEIKLRFSGVSRGFYGRHGCAARYFLFSSRRCRFFEYSCFSRRASSFSNRHCLVSLPHVDAADYAGRGFAGYRRNRLCRLFYRLSMRKTLSPRRTRGQGNVTHVPLSATSGVSLSRRSGGTASSTTPVVSPWICIVSPGRNSASWTATCAIRALAK